MRSFRSGRTELSFADNDHVRSEPQSVDEVPGIEQDDENADGATGVSNSNSALAPTPRTEGQSLSARKRKAEELDPAEKVGFLSFVRDQFAFHVPKNIPDCVLPSLLWISSGVRSPCQPRRSKQQALASLSSNPTKSLFVITKETLRRYGSPSRSHHSCETRICSHLFGNHEYCFVTVRSCINYLHVVYIHPKHY